MDVAIVTGADSRFGDAVCRTLLKMGFRIHALGQNPDASGYDSRYYIPHSYGAGKLAELKGCLEDALTAEERVDLLVGLGGPEVTTGWEDSSPESLVRRLHGCLTEPLLAASVCLQALRKSKGFLIHGHRRPVAKDLSVSPGYFENAMQKAYDDLFIRHANAGLRTARILYAFPESESEESNVYQDIAESVSRAFEIILRQKETCIVREMSIAPRGLGPVGIFPNLVSGMDPYQTTVLPQEEEDEEDPILIPTEKPRHYVQIAEVKDITDGEGEDLETYPDEEDPIPNESNKPNNPERQKSSSRRRRRPSRSRSRPEKQRPQDNENRENSESEKQGEKSESTRNPDQSGASGQPGAPKGESAETAKPRNSPAKKAARKRPSRPRKKAAPKDGAKPSSPPKESKPPTDSE